MASSLLCAVRRLVKKSVEGPYFQNPVWQRAEAGLKVRRCATVVHVTVCALTINVVNVNDREIFGTTSVWVDYVENVIPVFWVSHLKHMNFSRVVDGRM